MIKPKVLLTKTFQFAPLEKTTENLQKLRNLGLSKGVTMYFQAKIHPKQFLKRGKMVIILNLFVYYFVQFKTILCFVQLIYFNSNLSNIIYLI